MKRLYFCFNFWKKKKENIALGKNKKIAKGCFKPSEYILYLTFFPPPNHGGRHYWAFPPKLLSQFLNKPDWNVWWLGGN